jgi:hypothetical protein
MIKYQLICNNEHRFDGWFPNIAEFERQQEKKLLICPMCDSNQVDRAIMAPRIGKNKNKSKTKTKNKSQLDKEEFYRGQFTDDTMIPASRAKDILRKIRKQIVTDFDNVGDRFVKEYRKHEKGERDDRFYGTPSKEEVKELLEEGIDLFHLPNVKDDA